mmetsp:Transcript_10619/g.16746  ORF Transcript_10619/g.16746 Transcript_10619/m.16746 type:complete len:91 (+) Transcript_10619:79-351(+)
MPPSGTESVHVDFDSRNCWGHSRIPIADAASGVGKVISTGLLLEAAWRLLLRAFLVAVVVVERRHGDDDDDDIDDDDIDDIDDDDDGWHD